MINNHAYTVLNVILAGAMAALSRDSTGEQGHWDTALSKRVSQKKKKLC